MIISRLILLGLILILPGLCASQTNWSEFPFDSGKHYKIELKGSKEPLIAVFVEKTDSMIVLKSKVIERIEIKFSNIKSVSEIDPENVKDGEYIFANIGASRYFFNPSGYSLPKGQWEYRNYYIFFNSFNGGITDKLSVGAGFEILSLSQGVPIYFLSGSYRTPLFDKFSAGVGIRYLGIVDVETGSTIPYFTATYGTQDHNLSFNLGYTINEFESGFGYWAISGQTRVSKRLALITDNFKIREEEAPIYTYGFRFLGDKTAIDLAFINNSYIIEEIVIGYPFVGFSVRL